MTNIRQTSIPIDLGDRSYPIFIGSGLLQNAADFIISHVRSKKAFIITDEKVAPLYLKTVQTGLEIEGFTVVPFIVPAGESSKSFARTEELVNGILEAGCDRHSVLISLGGGVVGDLGGFCASILLRGIDYIQIPTTLLSQTDSSVGGKTAINTKAGKNLIGTFHQPKAVLIDTDTLQSLDRRQLLAGYAEVAKYGLILKKDFWEWLEQNGSKVIDLDPQACLYAIEQSCRCKAEFVTADEQETKDIRALLNLGHTFGHAFEAASGMDGSILHGEGVAVGTICAAKLSVALGMLDLADMDRIMDFYKKAGLPTHFDSFNPSDLISLMMKDKKTLSSQLNFVLLKGIGEAVVVKNVSTALVEHVLKENRG